MKAVLESIQPYVRKRIFIGFLLLSLLVLAGVILAVWYIMFGAGESVLHQVAMVLLVIVSTLLVLLAILGIVGILVSLFYAKQVAIFNAPIRLALSLLFPVVMGLSKLLNVDVDKVKNSFIAVNNQLVCSAHMRLKPEEILLLAPHCIQWTGCPHKITVDIENCHRCGICAVNELVELKEKYGIHVGVATGGTLARKYVKEYRPKAIVAVACERDLTSGIQDSRPLPVLGVINIRPNGPCFNTTLNILAVEEAVCHFMGCEKGGINSGQTKSQGCSSIGSKRSG